MRLLPPAVAHPSSIRWVYTGLVLLGPTTCGLSSPWKLPCIQCGNTFNRFSEHVKWLALQMTCWEAPPNARMQVWMNSCMSTIDGPILEWNWRYWLLRFFSCSIPCIGGCLTTKQRTPPAQGWEWEVCPRKYSAKSSHALHETDSQYNIQVHDLCYVRCRVTSTPAKSRYLGI